MPLSCASSLAFYSDRRQGAVALTVVFHRAVATTQDSAFNYYKKWGIYRGNLCRE